MLNGAGSVYTYDGNSWDGSKIFASGGEDVSCPSAQFCAAIDIYGDVSFYRNPG